MRIATIVALTLATVGCKDRSNRREPAVLAPATAPAAGSAAKPAPRAPSFELTPATSLLRLGKLGGSVHPHQLVARDDGGLIYIVEVYGKLELGGRPIDTKDEVAVVLALNGDGKIRWARPIDGHCDLIAATRGTSTFIAGSCSHAITTESGKIEPPKLDDHPHIFIAMLDDQGAITWSRYMGNPGTQVVNGAAIDAAGNAVVVGKYGGSIDFGTGKLTSPDRDGFVASYDPTGKPRWVLHTVRGDVQAVLAAGDEVDIAGSFSQKTRVGKIALAAPEGGRFFARLGANGEPKAAFIVGKSASSMQRMVRASTGTVFLSADTLEGVKLFAITDQASELSTIKGKHWCLGSERYLAIDAKDTLWLETCVSDMVDLGDGPITGDAALSDVVVGKFDATGKCLGHVVFVGPEQDVPGGLAVLADGSTVAAWSSQLGPTDKSPHDWLIHEVYISAAIQKVPL
jgi:hypothetical protein